MRSWKVGPATVDVWEEGDESFGNCSVAGCPEQAVWRSSTQGKRCVEHAKLSG